MSSAVKVVCRVRPLNQNNDGCGLQVLSDGTIRVPTRASSAYDCHALRFIHYLTLVTSTHISG